MANKRTSKQPDQPKKNPFLVVSKSEAAEKITLQIERGKELKSRELNSPPELTQARDDKAKWKDYTYELLSRLFDDISIAVGFQRADRQMSISMGGTPFHESREQFKRDVQKCINELESLHDRLELIPELNPTMSTPLTAVKEQQPNTASRKVFL